MRHAAASTLRDNVDPREAARYECLTGMWWDRTGPFWPLHRLNELRSAYLRDALASAFDRRHFALSRSIAVNYMLLARRTAGKASAGGAG